MYKDQVSVTYQMYCTKVKATFPCPTVSFQTGKMLGIIRKFGFTEKGLGKITKFEIPPKRGRSQLML